MRAIKVRIYPNRKQLEMIHKSFGCARFVYNQALALKINRYQKFKENISIIEISKMVTFWKKTKEREWLKEANAQGLQQALRHLDCAYNKFFKEKKGFPKFKKKSGTQSYSVVGSVSIIDNKIKFPKLGFLNCRGLRKFEGIIRTATVSKNSANQYFVSFCMDDIEDQPKTININSSVGIDAGIKTMAYCSNGHKYYSPNPLKEIESKLKYYQRRQARCKKGSNSFKKWKLKIARIWNKITNIKKDFLHKVSLELVKNHDLISVEHLQINNMVKNHKLAHSILNMNWGEFFRFLEYKCDWYGKHFIKINPRQTSQECSNCHYINKDLKLSDREWICVECKTKHDRDFNASLNINKKGLDKFLKSSGGILNGEAIESRIPCF